MPANAGAFRTSPFKPASDQIGKTPVPAARRADYSILVVDRTKIVRETNVDLLGADGAGFSSTGAASINSAIEACRSGKIDVIIVDAGTCGHKAEGGYDTAQIAKLKEASPDAKIVVMALNFDHSVEERFMDAGAELVINKAPPAGDVKKAVDSVLPVAFIEPVKCQTNGKTVLIMTEDARLTEASAEVVTRSGYDALTAATYAEVVEKAPNADLIVIERGKNFECLEVLRRIRERNPDVKILVRSYGIDESGSDRLKDFDVVLPPFILPDMLRAALQTQLIIGQDGQEPSGAIKSGQKEENGPSAIKKQASILIVDDDELARSAMETLLGNDYDVKTAEDGMAGLEAYETALGAGTPPDLVISDRQMPQMCGADMAAAIKKLKPDAKVIFVTGYSDDSVLEPLRAVNPFAILDKSVSFEDLAKTVEQALSA